MYILDETAVQTLVTKLSSLEPCRPYEQGLVSCLYIQVSGHWKIMMIHHLSMSSVSHDNFHKFSSKA